MATHPRDFSMCFHDTTAIPGFPMRLTNPSSSQPSLHSVSLHQTILHLVRASDTHAAALHLARLALQDPSTIPHVVAAIRKHLLPPSRALFRPAHPVPAHAPALLHHLVRSVPYFYRYIASPSFFRALWRLQKRLPASPPALAVRLLVAAWAHDLALMDRDLVDPAAAFWVLAHRRQLARNVVFPPLPRAAFVCRATPDASLPSAPRMSPSDLRASLHLLERIVSAARLADGTVSPTSPPDSSALPTCSHSSRPTPKRRRSPLVTPPRSPSSQPVHGPQGLSSHDVQLFVSDTEYADSGLAAPSSPFAASCEKPILDARDCSSTLQPKHAAVESESLPICPTRLNEKVLSVLRRHDDIFGRSDPYYIAPPSAMCADSWSIDPLRDESSTNLTRIGSSRASRSSAGSVQSVAAIARENARRKLSESQRSLSVSCFADRSSTDMGNSGRLSEGFMLPPCEQGEGAGECAGGDSAGGKKAITPSTFAGLEVSGGDSRDTTQRNEDDACQAMSSVGDTVKLPEMCDGLMCDGEKGSANALTVEQQIFMYMSSVGNADGGSVSGGHPSLPRRGSESSAHGMVWKSVGSTC